AFHHHYSLHCPLCQTECCLSAPSSCEQKQRQRCALHSDGQCNQYPTNVTSRYFRSQFVRFGLLFSDLLALSLRRDVETGKFRGVGTAFPGSPSTRTSSIGAA